MQEEPTSERGSYPEYRGRDRHGLAVVVARDGRLAVAGGPERIDAFAGETIRWKMVNIAGKNLTIEIKVKKHEGPGPEDPFEEGAREVQVPDKAGSKKTELILKVKGPAAFGGKVSRYKYELLVKGDPKSGLDPDLDIWP